MPKLKTRRSAAKRFKRTGTGKFVRRKAFRNLLLDKKKTKRKVRLGQKAVVVDADAQNVELMMPYS